jgi:release factor glutamine methyltransferase
MRTTIQYIRNELQDTHSAAEINELIKIIFCNLRNYSFTDIILKQDEELSIEEVGNVRHIVSRLKKYEPIQYILGQVEFCELQIGVNSQVLIPRPETEEFVQWIISEQKVEPSNALDIGTGSGCIALALKKAFVTSNISGIDISDTAIGLARKNAVHNQINVHFYQFDILNWKDFRASNKMDLIVSNPPYITEIEKIHIKRNVMDFEPHLALFVPDKDPLLYYRHIAEFAKQWLLKNGRLYFEINELYGPDVVRMLVSLGFSDLEIRKDFREKERMIKAILP